MPNHCNTTLHLDGEEIHRQEFVDKNKGFSCWDTKQENEYKDLSFHAQVPMPKKHINSHKKKTSNSDWYGWANKQWGTKWEAYEVCLDHHKNYTTYNFDTAWCIPEAWLKKVSKKFPNIKFNVEWAEEGGCGGRFMLHNGFFFHVHEFNEKEWKEFMGYDDDEE